MHKINKPPPVEGGGSQSVGQSVRGLGLLIGRGLRLRCGLEQEAGQRADFAVPEEQRQILTPEPR
ncbi:MAG: hypothetical protein JWN15_619, partial [Firmicutes bacterium]|nr:hypothetical protein [Bacillota bacterium]